METYSHWLFEFGLLAGWISGLFINFDEWPWYVWLPIGVVILLFFSILGEVITKIG